MGQVKALAVGSVNRRLKKAAEENLTYLPND